LFCAQAYFAFVSKRLDSFTGRFQELQLAPSSSTIADAKDDKQKAKGSKKKSKKQRQEEEVEVEVVAGCLSSETLEAAKELVELALAVPCVIPTSTHPSAAATTKGKGDRSRGAAKKKRSAYDTDDEEDEDEEDDDEEDNDEEEDEEEECSSLSAGGAQQQAVAVPNIVACDAQSLIADDLETLWKVLSLHLKAALVEAGEEGENEGGSSSGTRSLLDDEQAQELKEWWLKTLPQVAAWRESYKASFWHALKLKASPPDPEKWLRKADLVFTGAPGAAVVDTAFSSSVESSGVHGGGDGESKEDEEEEGDFDEDEEEEEEEEDN
jgi:hypothetical protein